MLVLSFAILLPYLLVKLILKVYLHTIIAGYGYIAKAVKGNVEYYPKWYENIYNSLNSDEL